LQQDYSSSSIIFNRTTEAIIKKQYFMKGVLLVNLGSPESPTAKDVKPYLDEF
jgi:hypothetical protein